LCYNLQICKTLFGTSNKRAYTLHGGCCSTDLCNNHDPDNTTVFDSGMLLLYSVSSPSQQ
jgi:hypothetical protein